MANKNDYYETLGINKQASDDDIKKAYRNMAKKYHPDNNPGDSAAEAKFKEVNEANAILSDGEKRRAYDQFGHAAFQQGGGGGGWGGAADFSDMFSSVFNQMDIGDIFGGGSRARRGPRRGADMQMRLHIKFEEAVFGTTRDIQMQTYDSCATCKGSGAAPGTHAETCKKCNGSGSERVVRQTMLGVMTTVETCTACRGEGKVIRDPCTTCRGQGRTRTTKTLQVTVPKGIDDGQQIRLTGKGEVGEKGAQAGDLYISVQVAPHKLFTRSGNNLHLDVPITFVQAALGDEISIPLLDGSEEKYVLKSGTQPGSVVSLKGKGVPSLRNNRNVGDLLVKLIVTVPTQMNDRQKELLKGFNEAMGDDYKYHKKRWFDKVKEYFM
ncbi:MAG: molecular chaperone DnaJ [Defluviitaleaceae bacterium]|nr:molecular chaperone DnaJ [Defluviitaleaceae bacterium]